MFEDGESVRGHEAIPDRCLAGRWYLAGMRWSLVDSRRHSVRRHHNSKVDPRSISLLRLASTTFRHGRSGVTATDLHDESELTVPRGTRSSRQGAVASRRKSSPCYAFADCRLDTQAYLLDRAGLAMYMRP